MEIKIIKNLDIYTKFVSNSEYNHYMKSIEYANLKTEFDSLYLGFYNNDLLVGTSLVFINKNFIKYAYIPTGLCIDYSNESLLKEALNLLINYLKNKKFSFIRIDPNVVRCSRDIVGNKTDLIDNEHITQYIKDVGFIHKGYGYGYNGSFTNRFTLIIDISKSIDELKSNFSKQRKTSLNRHEVIGLTTRIGNENDIKYICEFEKELSHIQGFKPHSYNFFKKIIDNFKEKSKIYVSEIDLDKMINGIDEELNSKKYSKDLQARLSKEKELQLAIEFKNKYGSKMVVACGLFIFINNKSWDLYTYNKKDCNFLKPVDNLHFFAISDMKNNNVKYYDMCGFSGSVEKTDKYYGLYNYKKSFNPEFIEMIGEFDYIINPFMYKTYLMYKKNVNRLKRKINTIFFKKD